MSAQHQFQPNISTGLSGARQASLHPVRYIRPMQNAAPKLSMAQVLLCGAVIVTMSMGIRHGFGLWLQPIPQAQGWTRETFSFALAIQNLAWGVTGIF